MARSVPAPTELELWEASRRRVLRELDTHDRVIELLKNLRDGNLAPSGCSWRVEGVTCTPEPALFACFECGETVRVCTRHGGATRAREELAAHEWEAHQIDDRTRTR